MVPSVIKKALHNYLGLSNYLQLGCRYPKIILSGSQHVGWHLQSSVVGSMKGNRQHTMEPNLIVTIPNVQPSALEVTCPDDDQKDQSLQQPPTYIQPTMNLDAQIKYSKEYPYNII